MSVVLPENGSNKDKMLFKPYKMFWRRNTMQEVFIFKENENIFISLMSGLASSQRFNWKTSHFGKSFVLRTDKLLCLIKDCLETKTTLVWQI